MLDLTVCVELIFTEFPFLKRLDKVKDAGIESFEFWDWRDKDIESIIGRKEALGLSVSSFTIGYSVDSLVRPNMTEKFVESVKSSLRVAKALECNNLIAPVGLGKADSGLDRKQQLKNAVFNFGSVCSLLEDCGVTLLIEPVNLVDHKGCFLSTISESVSILDEVESRNIKLIYDFYHQQISEGNLINNAKRYLKYIGMFHVGDVPGRHEPGTGEINFQNIFKFLKNCGYEGYVGLEFVPTSDHTKAVNYVISLFQS